MLPNLIKGGSHSDFRGSIRFNNTFNASEIKRFYLIENKSPEFIRRWQGHKIEQRWFTAVSGSFKIEIITIDNWEQPSNKLKVHTFIINANSMDILHVPPGNVSSIQAITKDAKLLAMSDYNLNEVNDEYKFSSDYFE